MKKLSFLFLLLFSFLLVTNLHAQRKISITVEVKPTKANGKAWDVGGGAPDIMVEIYHKDLGRLKSSTSKNTYKSTFEFDIRNITGYIEVKVWDKDLMAHDLIGSCEIHYATIDTYECGRATISVR